MPTLTWVGKDKVVNHHHEVPFRVLNKQYTFDASPGTPKNSTANRIIHGDNLEALKSLLPEFEGKVKCIYIDPPYNTGNEGWVYNDAVNDPKMQKWLGEVVGKEGEDLSRHDKWLCMMYPRLKLLRRLLTEDGAIFISIDDNEVATLRLLMDDLFGVGNFVASFVVQKRVSPDNDEKLATAVHDYLVCYSKGKSRCRFGKLPRTDEADARYENPDDDPRGLWTSSDLTRREYREHDFYPITLPSGRQVSPAAGRSWSVPPESFQRLNDDNRVWFGRNGNAMPRLKRFLSEVSDGMVPTTWFSSDIAGDNQQGKKELRGILFEQDDLFGTPKPRKLIQRILQIATDKDSIVLDSFAGSGTTGHAVLTQNMEDGGTRRFILVETMDYAETITAERVRRVMNGYGTGNRAVDGLGGGFDYYTIGDPLFTPDYLLNESVGIDAIRGYVAYTEGVQPEDQVLQDNPVSPYLLGRNADTAWFFYYVPDRPTALDMDFLSGIQIGDKPGTTIIYADRCLLSVDFMTRNGLIFKKIPRDISRF